MFGTDPNNCQLRVELFVVFNQCLALALSERQNHEQTVLKSTVSNVVLHVSKVIIWTFHKASGMVNTTVMSTTRKPRQMITDLLVVVTNNHRCE